MWTCMGFAPRSKRGPKNAPPRDVSEAALAHTVKDNAEAAYARSDFFEKRRSLMDKWGIFIAGSSAKVVALSA